MSLSTVSGVLSRYTALVAVDEDGKTIPKPQQPQPQQFELQNRNLECRRPSKRCTGTVASDIFSHWPDHTLNQYSTYSSASFVPKERGGASARQPRIQGASFGAPPLSVNCSSIAGASDSMFRGPKIKLYKKSNISLKKHGSPVSYDNVEREHNEAEEILESKNKDEILMKIVDLQEFSGSWKLSDILVCCDLKKEDVFAADTKVREILAGVSTNQRANGEIISKQDFQRNVTGIYTACIMYRRDRRLIVQLLYFATSG